ncbi:hypothetical protein I3843_04G093600 [Carya illinoinensis]|nr:hypothetical protein I3843_04G093600 [Carya illinoinensis]
MGLRDSFNNVRNQIMLIDPLPPVNKVFSYIQQQERHHLFTSSAPPTDSIALTGRKILSTPSPNPGINHIVHIAKSRLHGYPPNHKLHKSRANAASLGSFAEVNSEPSLMLTKVQYQDLIALLHSKDSSTPANQIQTVIPPNPHSNSITGISFFFSSSSLLSAPWIIDMGATNHIICSTSLFTIITTTISQSVKLSDGEIADVIHVGTVQVTTTILLHDVLCVPSFNFNLLSACKLVRELNCCLIFFSTLCFI